MRFYVFYCLLTLNLVCLGQQALKPFQHGLDAMYKLSSQTVIDDMRFSDGRDSIVDILRIDNVGHYTGNVGPILVSSKMPVNIDSMGSMNIKLQPDTLSNLLNFIKGNDVKSKSLALSEIQFKITYRENGIVERYFVSFPGPATAFFKRLEERIMLTRSSELLTTLHRLLETSPIMEWSGTRFKWRYSN